VKLSSLLGVRKSFPDSSLALVLYVFKIRCSRRKSYDLGFIFLQVNNKRHLHTLRSKNVVLHLVIRGLGHNTKSYLKDVKIKFLRTVKGYTTVECVIEKYETHNYADSGLKGCDVR